MTQSFRTINFKNIVLNAIFERRKKAAKFYLDSFLDWVTTFKLFILHRIAKQD